MGQLSPQHILYVSRYNVSPDAKNVLNCIAIEAHAAGGPRRHASKQFKLVSLESVILKECRVYVVLPRAHVMTTKCNRQPLEARAD